MRLMQTIAQDRGMHLDHNVDGQEEVMLALINEEQQRLKALHPERSDIAGSDSEAEEQQGEATVNDVLPLPPAAVTKPRRVSEAVDSKRCDTVPLPPPQSYSSTDDELVEVIVPQRAVQSTPSAATPPVRMTSVTTPSTATPSVTMPSVTTPSTAMPSVTTPSVATPSLTSSYVNTSSKNKRRQCSLCSFFGTHLQRQIAAKHPDTFTSKPKQIALVHRHDKLSATKSGKKEVRKFQCTYKKCGTIVTRIGQHLLRTHKIQDQRQRAEAQSRCLRLSRGTSRKWSAANPTINPPASKVARSASPNPTKGCCHDTSGEESSDAGTFESGESDMDEDPVDHHQLKVDVDIDDISSFADSDQEDAIPASENTKWRDFYLSKDTNKSVREYFMSRFYQYLVHIKGGAHSDHQALIHARQVHSIVATLDPAGKDLACLAKRSGMDIWDKFCVPKLRIKELTGNTLKVYLRSLQFFVKFIKKGLLYKASKLNQQHMEVILKLEDRLPDYRATIHQRTSHQVTTRKVDECYRRITPEDLRSFEQSEPAKSAVKLLGLAAEKQLTFAEFTTVHDYLIVTTMYENGSRPGPVENALVSRFLQVTYDAKTDRYTILVDKHKTTRHHSPAELTCTSRIYSYLQLYVLHVRSQFAAPGEDALFVKEDG